MFEYIEKKAETVRNLNYICIPVNIYDMNIKGIEEFNKVYFDIKKTCEKYEFRKIVRTSSGGISISKINFSPYMWDIRKLNSCVEITVIAGFSGMFRIQLRTKCALNNNINEKTKKQIFGRTAYIEFKKVCLKHNINIEDFFIENGEEIKKTIQKPFICFEKPYYQQIVFENVHHLDLNSSYMSGISIAFPQLKPVIEEIFEERKIIKEKKLNNLELTNNEIYKNDLLKAILTHTYGFMQSSQIKYKLAHMSKAALDFNNNMILNIKEKMIAQGFKPILYNTDGIWYTHPEGKIYHDENEGFNLGQWCNDHLNCKFEALSEGKYHFIENGKCKTVVRGRTKKDEIKERDEWTWEDLYDNKGMEILYVTFNEEKGANYYYA